MSQALPHILACVDTSAYALAVSDHAAWLAQRLGVGVELLTVIERHPRLDGQQDHSGAIGVDAHDALLQSLSQADAARSRQARDAGRLLLTQLRERLAVAGVHDVDIRQRHGDLEETLLEPQAQVAHYVMGRKGVGAHADGVADTPLWLLRSVRRPVWLVPERFVVPRRVLVAFDGSAASRRAITHCAQSPWIRDLDITVLMVTDRGPSRELDAAVQTLRDAGHQAQAMVRAGVAHEAIADVLHEQAMDVLVMGAYSHAWWRSVLRGSNTQELLRRTRVTALIHR